MEDWTIVFAPTRRLHTATATPLPFIATADVVVRARPRSRVERAAEPSAGRLDRGADRALAAGGDRGEHDHRAALAVDLDVGRRAAEAEEVARLGQPDVLRCAERAAGRAERGLDHLRAAPSLRVHETIVSPWAFEATSTPPTPECRKNGSHCADPFGAVADTLAGGNGAAASAAPAAASTSATPAINAHPSRTIRSE